MPDYSELAKIRHEMMVRLFGDRKPKDVPEKFEELPNDVREHLTGLEREFMTLCINRGILQFSDPE